jgi:hypothetical protein
MAEFVALMIVLTIHRRRMTTRTRRSVWVTLAVCTALILLNKLVTTRREQLVAAIGSMAQAVDEADLPAITSRLDDEFQYGHWDKAGFVAELNRKLQDWRIDEVSVGGFEIDLTGQSAKVAFRASCDWRGHNESQTGVVSFWTQEWVLRPDGWKLRRILGAKVGPNGMFDLRDLWHY